MLLAPLPVAVPKPEVTTTLISSGTRRDPKSWRLRKPLRALPNRNAFEHRGLRASCLRFPSPRDILARELRIGSMVRRDVQPALLTNHGFFRAASACFGFSEGAI